MNSSLLAVTGTMSRQEERGLCSLSSGKKKGGGGGGGGARGRGDAVLN